MSDREDEFRARAMPVQKPGRSKQDYGTPRDFLDALERRFGSISFDLAAHRSNAVVPSYFGEGGVEEDSLAQKWHLLSGNLFLNPPFGDIVPWAMKCRVESASFPLGIRYQRILFLVPASVGANWFAEHVHNHALVLALQGRLSFDGKDPYPKDCMLCVFGEKPGFDVWKWRA
jgi:phage N-6-adenine-methyltransferase